MHGAFITVVCLFMELLQCLKTGFSLRLQSPGRQEASMSRSLLSLTYLSGIMAGVTTMPGTWYALDKGLLNECITASHSLSL